MAGHIQTAKNTVWRNPQSIIELVKEFFGGIIELDPCASDNVEKHFALHNLYLANEDDGLTAQWRELKTYCNPPYTRTIKQKWIRKAFASTAEVLMLIPATPGSRIWQEIVLPNAQICFVKGRIRFELDGEESAGAPMDCAIVGFHIKDISKFKDVFSTIGTVLTTPSPDYEL